MLEKYFLGGFLMCDRFVWETYEIDEKLPGADIHADLFDLVELKLHYELLYMRSYAPLSRVP